MNNRVMILFERSAADDLRPERQECSSEGPAFIVSPRNQAYIRPDVSWNTRRSGITSLFRYGHGKP